MKVWIVVYNYGLINEDVGVFTSLEDARRGFREYTGFDWEPERKYKEVGIVHNIQNIMNNAMFFGKY